MRECPVKRASRWLAFTFHKPTPGMNPMVVVHWRLGALYPFVLAQLLLALRPAKPWTTAESSSSFADSIWGANRNTADPGVDGCTICWPPYARLKYGPAEGTIQLKWCNTDTETDPKCWVIAPNDRHGGRRGKSGRDLSIDGVTSAQRLGTTEMPS